MPITSISANLSCRDLEASITWYAALFGKKPARRPMAGLAEWTFGRGAEVQLYEAPEHAGHGTLTLAVDDLDLERARLSAGGVKPQDIERGDRRQLMRMRDPDGNLVVMTSTESQPEG